MSALMILRRLPRRPTHDQITEVAVALLQRAIDDGKPEPAKAVGAVLRSHRATLELSDATVKRVRDLATARWHAERRRLEAEREPKAGYCDEVAAAQVHGLNPAELRAGLLTDANERRIWGWPYVIGNKIRIPIDAVRPDTRAAFLSRQPQDEPPAHAASFARLHARLDVKREGAA
jgi:hypothetical protein